MTFHTAAASAGAPSTSNTSSSSSSPEQKVDSNSHATPAWTSSELATLQEAHFNDAPPSYEASGVPRYERYPRPLLATGRDGQHAQAASNMANTQIQPSPQILAAMKRRKRNNLLLLGVIIIIMLAGFAALAQRCGDRNCWG